MAVYEPVNVWIADLDAAARQSCEELLSDDERARAAELTGERARARWIASRAILRAIVGDFAGLDPHTLRFELGPYGKPRLATWCHRSGVSEPRPTDSAGGRGADLPPAGQLCFNASHSGSLAVYALAWEREVGVDVELADRRRSASRDELAIARRMLGGEVEQRLAGMAPTQRADAFLREWTAYEARVKCLGTGIGAARDDVATAIGLGELSVAEIDVGAGAFAAVASEGAAAVRVRKWR